MTLFLLLILKCPKLYFWGKIPWVRSCSPALEIYFSISGSAPEIILLMFSLQTKGKAFFVSINAVFSRAWLCSKGKQKQDLPKESPLLRVKPHQFLLIIRRRKCSPILFFQEYILKEETILRNFYTSVELYLNSENLVCLRDSLIWQLSKHNMRGLFLHMRESYQNRIFLHKTFQVPGQKLTSVLCILSLIPKKNVYNL